MCFGSSKPSNTKPPEPTPATRFDYRAGEKSMLDQQRGVANMVAPPPKALGSELGSSPVIAPYAGGGDPGGAAY
jgi:hypothetical protein